MPSEGPNNPGTFANAGTGTAWSGESNAGASDNTYAACSVPGGGLSQELTVTNFGFSVPGGNTVVGVEVAIERKGEVLGAIQDSTVKLIKGGSVVGDNKASADFWPDSDGTKPYGSSSDAWGVSLSDSDVNASNFGVHVKVFNATKAIRAASVDHITITVHYTAAAAGHPARKRMGGVQHAYGGYQPKSGIMMWRHQQPGGLWLPDNGVC
jgi:hypothetical protein